MALEIERKLVPATGSEVADWVEHIASEVLITRATMVAEIESSTSMSAAEARDSSHVQNVMQAKSTLMGQTVGLGHQHPPSVATRLDRQSNAQQPQAQANALQQTMAMSASAQPMGQRPMYPSLVDGPPVTQPSSISVASHAQLKPYEERRGGNRTAVAAIAGVMLGASVLASALVYRNTQQGKTKLATTPVMGTAEPTTPAGTAAVVTPPPAAAEVADAGAVATATIEPALVAPASATPKASATAKPPRPPAGAATTRATDPKPPATVSTDCTTPVWFDAQGVKHYKPQCLDTK
jgi:serine/threonine-protein kinase